MDDMPILLELGREMVAEAPEFRGLTFDEGRLTNFLSWVIEKENGAAWLADEALPGRTPVSIGVLVVFEAMRTFALEPFVGDFGLFVRPPWRGHRAAIVLVHRMEEWAEGRGLTDIQMGISTGVHLDSTSLFYERLGYHECSRTFRKCLPG